MENLKISVEITESAIKVTSPGSDEEVLYVNNKQSQEEYDILTDILDKIQQTNWIPKQIIAQHGEEAYKRVMGAYLELDE